jgi:hypothetical protein
MLVAFPIGTGRFTQPIIGAAMILIWGGGKVVSRGCYAQNI